MNPALAPTLGASAARLRTCSTMTSSTIAVKPEVILMDEPCSALDPIATGKIEELIDELKQNYSIVIVTHSMQQAYRVSDRVAYFHMGDLIEVGGTKEVFNTPHHELTQDYISGRFG